MTLKTDLGEFSKPKGFCLLTQEDGFVHLLILDQDDQLWTAGLCNLLVDSAHDTGGAVSFEGAEQLREFIRDGN